MNRTIAVFGGSFNPPHLAHQMICLVALESFGVQEVWMIPTYTHAFGKTLIPFQHRLEMCRLAAQIFPSSVRVVAIEQEISLAGGNPARMYEVLTALQQRHSTTQFRLVIGADILEETDQWYHWDQVEKLAPPIIIGRAGYKGGRGVKLPSISSTEIRESLASGAEVCVVPHSVMQYIRRNHLYEKV